MTYPYASQPTGRADSSLNLTTQAADHNSFGAALNDLLAVLGTNPKGSFATVTAAVANIVANTIASDGSFHHIAMVTAATYAAIGTPDPDTWYVIVG